MIVRSGLSLGLVRRLGPLLAMLLAYDVAVTALYVGLGWRWVGISDLPLPLLGSAIVLMVTLRNNAAYARWMEARGLWGAVANNSRNLARVMVVLSVDAAVRERVVRMQIAYVLALRCHLLRVSPWEAVAGYVPAEVLAGMQGAQNVPGAILAAIARELAPSGLDGVGLVALDRALGAVTDAQGGLERIKGTPLPAQYTQFPLVFTRVYCVLLPIGLLNDLGVLTPIASTLVGFMFLALDRVGRDLEAPFEGSMHDVPMASITRGVEIDLLQGLGVAAPAPVAAVEGVLW